MMEYVHRPVLLNETIEALNIRPEGIYLDGTIGGGGHSYEIAKALTGGGRLIGIDQDEEAVRAAKERLREFEDRVTIVHDNYANYESVLNSLGIDLIDGIVLDLGVSSYQIDNPERGFSYMTDSPLDMRMDATAALSARDIVNEYSEEELYRVIRDYGEDPHAGSIAKRIVRERAKAPIETTSQLAQIVRMAIPPKERYAGHPEKRTFQAVRIECNGELDALDSSLDGMIMRLRPGGRIAVITFHSLEDRIVKNKFRENQNPCICPPDLPVCMCGRKSRGQVITRKPVVAGDQETAENSRARSARLRVFERS